MDANIYTDYNRKVIALGNEAEKFYARRCDWRDTSRQTPWDSQISDGNLSPQRPSHSASGTVRLSEHRQPARNGNAQILCTLSIHACCKGPECF